MTAARKKKAASLKDAAEPAPEAAEPPRLSGARPAEALIGHAAAFGRIQSALAQGRLGHAYLIYGTEGIGRKTFARAVARILLCRQGRAAPSLWTQACDCASCAAALAGEHAELGFLDPEKGKRQIGIDAVRDLIESIQLRPAHADQPRVYIVGDAAEMTDEAANAFLKTLEEPPPGVFFLLICERRSQVLATIRSRCQPLRLERLSIPELQAGLQRAGASLAESESLAQSAAGRLGWALAMRRAPEAGLDPERLIDARISPSQAAAEWSRRLTEIKDGDGTLEAKRQGIFAALAEIYRMLRDAQTLKCQARAALLAPHRQAWSQALSERPSVELDRAEAALVEAERGLWRNLNLDILLDRLSRAMPRVRA